MMSISNIVHIPYSFHSSHICANIAKNGGLLQKSWESVSSKSLEVNADC